MAIFQAARKIIFGRGVLSELGNEISYLGKTRALVVSDPGVTRVGITGRLVTLLTDVGVQVEVFDRVEAEPRIEVAEECLSVARRLRSDLVVGIGGGSSLDVAKVAAGLFNSPGGVRDYLGVNLIRREGLPLIAIPTTAGTGSETTGIAILTDAEAGVKQGIVSTSLFPHLAIVDPELTVSLPPAVTAYTGIDALIHAVEAYLSVNASSISDALALQAINLISSSIRECYTNGSNISARGKMAEGSLLAGMAFANAGVGAVHAFSYPLGARYHLAHGLSNALMFIPVLSFNLDSVPDRMRQIGEVMGLRLDGATEKEAGEATIKAIATLLSDLGIPANLKEAGVREETLAAMASAVLEIKRLLNNNPRQIDYLDALAIYGEAFQLGYQKYQK